MTLEIGLIFVVTIATFVLFATEKLRTDVLALAVLCVLGLAGYFQPEAFLTSKDVLGCFSNAAPVTVAAMFVIGAGLTRTGALEGIGNQLLKLAERGETFLVAAMMVIVSFVSAFLNNTAVVMFFLPVVLQVCAQKRITPSRMLIPLSYAAMFGGCCTLIGTSTNIVVSEVAMRSRETPIGLFEPTRLGVVFVLAGVAYVMLFGRRLLPQRETLTTLLSEHGGREFRTELVVLHNSPLVGQRLGAVRAKKLRAGTILGVTRGGEPVDPPFDQIVLADGDRIIMNLAISDVRDVQTTRGLALLPAAELGIEQIGAEATTMIEAIIPLNSSIIGKTLGELDYPHRYGVRILALHRQGMNVREQVDQTPLRFGDTLLMQGTEEDVAKLRDDRSLLLLSPVKIPEVRRHKAWLAIAIVAGVMAAITFTPFPVAQVAITGALLLVLTRCIDMNEAYEAINWNIIMLIIGMLGLGLAMEKSGGAAFVANTLNHWVGDFGPYAALSGTYLLCTLLTEMVSNNAVAALMTPIAISSAKALGCDPHPFVFAVMFAASASFATPVGYQTNTMIYGAGGYKFRDFFKVGLPLNLLFWVLATILIPLFWPLR